MAVYNAVVVSNLVYGCEAWVLKERDKGRLQAAEMKVLRRVAGITKLDCVRNEDMRESLPCPTRVAQVERRRGLEI